MAAARGISWQAPVETSLQPKPCEWSVREVTECSGTSSVCVIVHCVIVRRNVLKTSRGEV